MADKNKKLRPTDLSLFCTQISLFLRSGLSLPEGLSLMREDVGDARFQSKLAVVCEAVDDRMPLSEALQKAGGFPDYMVRMAEIGEVSGNLDDIMGAMAKYYEREENLRRRVRTAVTYPLALIVMMTAIVFLLIVQVLPMFSDLLTSLGRSMPPVVTGLMAFGDFVAVNILWIAGGIVLLVLFFQIFKRTTPGAAVLDRMKASFPLTRGVYKKMSAERFATAMGFLLSSSVDLDISMELSEKILGNSSIASRVEECRALMSGGLALDEALQQVGIFPRLFSKMLGIGMKSGDLDGMMARLASIYEKEVDDSLKRVTGAIEPAFVAILSIVVGVILISVMMPLIEVMTVIGG